MVLVVTIEKPKVAFQNNLVVSLSDPKVDIDWLEDLRARLHHSVEFGKACEIGYGCGATCITRSNQCQLQLGGVAREAADYSATGWQKLVNWERENAAKIRETVTGARDAISEKAKNLPKPVQGLVDKILYDEDIHADAIVNTGGLVGSIVGGAVGGNTGALTGDLVGALAVRGVLVTRRAYVEAERKLQAEGNVAQGKKLQNVARQARATVSELLSPASRAKIESELFGDVAGWAIGNTSAGGINSQLSGIAARIPFKGAVVAMATVPKLNGLRERFRAGVENVESREAVPAPA